MKKRWILAIMLLLSAGMILLDITGVSLRSVLAPTAHFWTVVYTPDGLLVPTEAVRFDPQTGKTYVYLAEKTGKFPEGGYEAVRRDCTVQDTVEAAYLLCMWDAYDLEVPVLGTSDKAITPGCMVLPYS